MKREALLRQLRRYGCFLKREGRSHSLWSNPQTGQVEAVPRHIEIPERLAKKICALAEKEKCDLVTGDSKLFNSITKELVWVKWIGDYPALDSTSPS
jgi:mRNA interferase HicA